MVTSHQLRTQHWGYLRFVVLAIGGLLFLAWWARTPHHGAHGTAALAALWTGMAAWRWVDAWLQGPDRRATRVRDAVLLSVVAVVFLVQLYA